MLVGSLLWRRDICSGFDTTGPNPQRSLAWKDVLFLAYSPLHLILACIIVRPHESYVYF